MEAKGGGEAAKKELSEVQDRQEELKRHNEEQCELVKVLEGRLKK